MRKVFLSLMLLVLIGGRSSVFAEPVHLTHQVTIPCDQMSVEMYREGYGREVPVIVDGQFLWNQPIEVKGLLYGESTFTGASVRQLDNTKYITIDNEYIITRERPKSNLISIDVVDDAFGFKFDQDLYHYDFYLKEPKQFLTLNIKGRKNQYIKSYANDAYGSNISFEHDEQEKVLTIPLKLGKNRLVLITELEGHKSAYILNVINNNDGRYLEDLKVYNAKLYPEFQPLELDYTLVTSGPGITIKTDHINNSKVYINDKLYTDKQVSLNVSPDDVVVVKTKTDNGLEVQYDLNVSSTWRKRDTLETTESPLMYGCKVNGEDAYFDERAKQIHVGVTNFEHQVDLNVNVTSGVAVIIEGGIYNANETIPVTLRDNKESFPILIMDDAGHSTLYNAKIYMNLNEHAFDFYISKKDHENHSTISTHIAKENIRLENNLYNYYASSMFDKIDINATSINPVKWSYNTIPVDTISDVFVMPTFEGIVIGSFIGDEIQYFIFKFKQ